MKVHGLIIDPQQDFCDPATGALYVPGAEDDMVRLATLIHRFGDRIDRIHVTLDSHHYVHIAHPIWWIDAAGRHPEPFTIISASDVEEGRWRAARPAWARWRPSGVTSARAPVCTNGVPTRCSKSPQSS